MLLNNDFNFTFPLEKDEKRKNLRDLNVAYSRSILFLTTTCWLQLEGDLSILAD